MYSLFSRLLHGFVDEFIPIPIADIIHMHIEISGHVIGLHCREYHLLCRFQYVSHCLLLLTWRPTES